MVLISPLDQETEDVEILWLAGLHHHPESGWRVLLVTRGLTTAKVKPWPMTIGLLPFLAPGRRLSGGILLETSARGLFDTVVIADLADGEEVGSNCIPRRLYSFEGHHGGRQRLLRYRVGRMEYLIPTIELVRFLFLHNRTLAHVLMQPGGLMTLFAPMQPGIHPHLDLRFTAQMPVGNLSPEFAMEFAWLAVHPDGRRSWDSVYERTNGKPHVSFLPPSLKQCRLTFRGVRHGSQWLVLEIRTATGKPLPCDSLGYSHPSLHRVNYVDLPGEEGRRRQGKPDAARSDRGGRHPPQTVVDSLSHSSRFDVHQKALHVPGKAGTFDREIEVEKVIWKEVKVRPPAKPEEAPTVPPDTTTQPGPGPVKHRRIVVSAGDEADGAEIPPIEFRLLEPAGRDYLGELEPLMKVVRMVARYLPDMQVSMSLCYLKPERAFSMVGRNRRVCLVATFTPVEGGPVVLLDVDHSGEKALSSLLLRYDGPCGFGEIETHIHALLDRLVDRSGRWDPAAEDALPEQVTCERLPKVLRRHGAANRRDYLEAWSERLMERIVGSD